MQVVYLSNRPRVLAGTLEAVAHWMPWVSSAIVVGPAGTTFADGPLPLTVVDDGAVTGRSAAELAAMDHVTRNVTLRRSLLDHDLLDDRFILSDDDYRPLAEVGLDNYVDDRGRHHRYWFHRLEDWPGRRSDYDRAQIRTLAALRLLDAPTLAYGSHMPQIVDRAMFTSALDTADELGVGPLLDEWSLYFNLAPVHHPDAFAPPRPFQTLAWPQWPHEWRHAVRPHPIRFENHYPSHEAPGGLFHGLPAVTEPGGALARVEAWRVAELAIGELDFDPRWSDPWTRGRPVRRAATVALRGLRKVRRYTSL